MLVRSVRNIARPRIEPQAVAALAARLPDDPTAIEAYVLGRQVPYAYDWQSADVPWYFPTTTEAVAAGRGDCESRAVVLARILTAKGIPNDLRVSLGHIWVDYPGKEASVLENEAVQVAGVKDGRFFLHWPEDLDLGRGDLRAAGDPLDAGAGLAPAAAVRRPLADRALEHARASAGRRRASPATGCCPLGSRAAAVPAGRAGAPRGAPAPWRARLSAPVEPRRPGRVDIGRPAIRSPGICTPRLQGDPMRTIDLRSDTVTRPSARDARGDARGGGRRRRARRRPDGARPAGPRCGAPRQGGRAVLPVRHHVQPGGGARADRARRRGLPPRPGAHRVLRAGRAPRR